MTQGETVLTGGEHPGTELDILYSKAGWYLGFESQNGEPYSRETVYFETRKQATDIWLLIRR